MKSSAKRLAVLGFGAVVLFGNLDEARAGLIEVIETCSSGQLTLSIEGNALRLTDISGGYGVLRVFNAPGFGNTAAADLGFLGDWPAHTVLGAPLQDDVLLPSTRLDSLLGGIGIRTTGNVFYEIIITDSSGNIHALDIDSVEVIGGPAPEPSTLLLTACGAFVLLRRKSQA